MKGDGRFYFACAVMLLALPGCTQGISAAVPLEDSYAMAEPNDDLSPGERGLPPRLSPVLIQTRESWG